MLPSSTNPNSSPDPSSMSISSRAHYYYYYCYYYYYFNYYYKYYYWYYYFYNLILTRALVGSLFFSIPLAKVNFAFNSTDLVSNVWGEALQAVCFLFLWQKIYVLILTKSSFLVHFSLTRHIFLRYTFPFLDSWCFRFRLPHSRNLSWKGLYSNIFIYN